MKILITGAAGFIGFHLSKKLLDDFYQIIGIDNVNDYYCILQDFSTQQEVRSLEPPNAEYRTTHCGGESHWKIIAKSNKPSV